jgi:PAS domain S-box-containing protein
MSTDHRTRTPASTSLVDALFDEPGAARCLVDEADVVVRVNADLCRYASLGHERALGAAIAEVLPVPPALVRGLFARARAGQRVMVPRHAQRVDGREARWEGDVAPVDLDGEAGLLVTLREIAAAPEPRAAAFDGADELEDRLRDFVRVAPFPVMLHTDGGDVLEVSRGWTAVTGYTVEDLPTLDRWTELAYGAEGPDVRALIAAVYSGDAPVRGGELTIRTHRGERRTLLFSAAPLGTVRGRRIGVSMAVDVTERARAEAALRASERRYRDLVELSPDATFVTRGDRIELVNAAALALFGARAPRELLDRSPYDFFPPDYHATMRARIASLREHGGQTERIETTIVRLDGGERQVDVAAAAVDDGDARSILVVLRDITDRKAAERALRESEERAHARTLELKAVLDAVPVPVLITRDPDAMHIESNAAGRALLGLPTGANASYAVPESERPAYVPMRDGRQLPLDDMPMQAAARFGRFVEGLEIDVRRGDGEVRHIVANARPLLGPDGERQGAVGAFADITERKRAEEALREADRRKTTFLAVLSHELRNPLAPILNALTLLERAPSGSPKAARALDVLRRQARHMTTLVDDLLDRSRIDHGKISLDRETLDARQVVDHAASDVRPSFDERGVALDVDLEGAPAPVWVDADATRLAQLVTNLLTNARKFTAAGGLVRVGVAVAGGACEIRVSDDGEGIDPAALDTIFEPFAQASRAHGAAGGGLGIGLSLVRSLAELHGGSAHAESEGPGRGASFVVRLPLAPPPATAR